MSNMQRHTKFLWLRHAAGIGEQIDNWRVCWIDGWDKCRILFVEIVESFGDPEQISLRHSRVTPILRAYLTFSLAAYNAGSFRISLHGRHPHIDLNLIFHGSDSKPQGSPPGGASRRMTRTLSFMSYDPYLKAD
jgi:hypothetical protein